MAHYFRVIYHTDDDPRRHTKFFSAEPYPMGFKLYFPQEFTANNIHLESISIFDEALMPSPPPQPRWEDFSEEQRARIIAMAPPAPEEGSER